MRLHAALKEKERQLVTAQKEDNALADVLLNDYEEFKVRRNLKKMAYSDTVMTKI
jgi:hypothetical protein